MLSLIGLTDRMKTRSPALSSVSKVGLVYTYGAGAAFDEKDAEVEATLRSRPKGMMPFFESRLYSEPYDRCAMSSGMGIW